MQHARYLLLGVAHGEFPDTCEDGGGRAADVTRPPGAGDREGRTSVGLPSNGHLEGRGAPREGDIRHKEAHQLFALALGGGWRVPDRGQVADEVQNLLALLGTEDPGTALGYGRIVALQPLDLGQLRIPLPLQAPGHEPVFGFDGQEATAREVGFILCALQAAVPLLRNLARLGFQPIEGRQSDVQVSRLDGVEERPGAGGVAAGAPQGLAGRRSEIDMRPGTGLERGRPILQVADPHPPPTLAAQDKALEEGRALADGAPVLLRSAGAVVRQTGLMPQEVVPGEIGWVDIVEENGPVLGGDPASGAFDPRGVARPRAGPGGGPAVDVGAGIRRVVEDSKYPGVA